MFKCSNFSNVRAFRVFYSGLAFRFRFQFETPSVYASKYILYHLINENFSFIFIFKLCSEELGLVDGEVDPSRTVRKLTYDCESDAPYKAFEVFGDEVCSMVTSTSLYRETAFTIFMPTGGPMIGRLGGYLASDEALSDDCTGSPSIRCPWMYVRRFMSVCIWT